MGYREAVAAVLFLPHVMKGVMSVETLNPDRSRGDNAERALGLPRWRWLPIHPGLPPMRMPGLATRQPCPRGQGAR
jgi:hypothetical protein